MAIIVQTNTGEQIVQAGDTTWNADSLAFNAILRDTWFSAGPFLKESIGGIGSTMANIVPAAAFSVTVPANSNFVAAVSGTGVIVLTGTTRMSTAVELATGTSGGVTFNGDTDTHLTRPASNELRMTTGGIAALTVNNSQNVGIGTTTPTEKLDVVGPMRSLSPTGAGTLWLENGQTTPGTSVTSGNIFFKGQDSVGTSVITARILGQMKLDTAGAHDGSLIFYTTRAGTSTEAMRIRESGFVGINTNDPTTPLDVNGNVVIRGKITQLTTATVGLNVNALAGTSANCQRWTYDDVTAAFLILTATQRTLQISAADLGNDVIGPRVFIQNNSNATNSGAGNLAVSTKSGSTRYLWPDNTGNWRTGAGQPIGSADLGGVLVSSQSSYLAAKDLLSQWDDPMPALQTVLDTPIYNFEYKQNEAGVRMFDGETFVGGVTDYSPWLGMDNGKALNPINVAGYHTLSIQALHTLITDLTVRVTALEEGA